MSSQNKIIVGLSGGVDSSVSAYLLLQQGFQVEALFMKNWDEDDDDEYCSASEDLADAQQVADLLGIKLHTVNFSHEYWEDVFEHFLSEHKKGRTPNPDVLCNQRIKFKAFLDYAKDLGADKIATGHYARIANENGKYFLKAGVDGNKDQSYFLHSQIADSSQFHVLLFYQFHPKEISFVRVDPGSVNAESNFDLYFHQLQL